MCTHGDLENAILVHIIQTVSHEKEALLIPINQYMTGFNDFCRILYPFSKAINGAKIIETCSVLIKLVSTIFFSSPSMPFRHLE